jgi:hypothetical protein
MLEESFKRKLTTMFRADLEGMGTQPLNYYDGMNSELFANVS